YKDVIDKLNTIKEETDEHADQAEKLTDFSVSGIADWMIRFLSKRLSLEQERIDPKETFANLGVTSLIGVETFEHLQRLLPCKINVTDFWSYPDIHSLASYLAEKIKD